MVEGFAAVDGYSVWMRTGEKPLREGSFSLCFSLFPLGFSGGEDGIFSWLDRKEKKGFSVGLLKGGRVRIRFGNGKTLFGFDSINAHVRIREWNRIIVIFRQDAGWCDLYVNGVLSNRKQFLRHMRPAFPEGMAFLGKYADGDENSEISKTGAFYGYLQKPVWRKGNCRQKKSGVCKRPCQRKRRTFPVRTGAFTKRTCSGPATTSLRRENG